MSTNEFKEKIDFFEKFFSQKVDLLNKLSTTIRVDAKINPIKNTNRNENNNSIEPNKKSSFKIEDLSETNTLSKTDERSGFLSLNSKLSKSFTQISIDNKLQLKNDQFIQTKFPPKIFQKPTCKGIEVEIQKKEQQSSLQEENLRVKRGLSSAKIQLSDTDLKVEKSQESVKKEKDNFVFKRNLKTLHKMLLTAKCYCVLVFEEKSIEDCRKLIKILCDVENFVFDNLMRINTKEVIKQNDLFIMNIQNKLCDFHMQHIRLRSIFGGIFKCKLDFFLFIKIFNEALYI